MKRMLHSLPQAIALSTAIIATLGFSATSHAEPSGYNQISFSTQVQTEVENDEISASLYKQVQASTPQALATQLNSAMNQAIATAKRYPSVKVSTGQHHSYPRYDDNRKIIGWTGRASIHLTSTDLAKTSELIAELQNTLILNQINFGVSQSKQDRVEKELLTQASKAFQQQASSLASAWNASGYRVVSVSLNSQGNYAPPMLMRNMAMSESENITPPAPNFESGNSTLSVSANGTIELVQ
ncbi:SIMPL domain-containing protein [Psychrobacter sp. I-STPA6b]|uniref:SIMPL domain-containing protein n=1 Tax=Psychrobacter sp. I-STPA6b TaxID=2585718 RepID=UPI001D0CAB8A|nr:SIMPL domain-containing protein [Psychrobacter sp. I-STPA6b]